MMNAQLFFREIELKENDRQEDSVAIWHFNNTDYSCNAKNFIDWLSTLKESNIKDITFKGFNFEFKICEEESELYAYYFNNEKLNYDYRFIENGKIKSEYILEDMLNLKNRILLRYGLFGRCSHTVFACWEESSIFKFKLPSGNKEFGTISYENWGQDDHIAILDMFVGFYKNKDGSYEFGSEGEPGYEYTYSTGLKIINRRIYYVSQVLEYSTENDGISQPHPLENHEYLLLGTPEQIASELCADMEREKDSWASFGESIDGDKEKSKSNYLSKLSELQTLVRKY